ncbi:hypothetical protein ACFYTF_29005 [Nocardia thailandica]|uniref:Uncharacterized protein n=1 Tax=Nocardia thailandica TaxID=257275 RepID=A0ABW6PXM1_9NOCA
MSAYEHINAASLEAARRAGWPELTGSPAQIGWAATIRRKRIREFDDADTEMTAAARAAFREVLLQVTAAEDWIDTQYNPHWEPILLVRQRGIDGIADLARL